MRFTDPNIFEKVNQGDISAFNHLFEETYSSLCFFANKYLSDMDLSRSLVQQLFVDIWIKKEKLHIHSSPQSYLYHAVRNRSIDHLRKTKNNVSVSELMEAQESLPFHDIVEEAELTDRINSSINQLPEKCRSIFILSRFEELKYAEIAKQLGISIKTVEMQMGIALKRIRKNLSDYGSLNLFIYIFSKKD